MSTDVIILALRAAISLTFLILAVGGPYALHKLNRFIKAYVVSHGNLVARVEAIERRVTRLETQTDATE